MEGARRVTVGQGPFRLPDEGVDPLAPAGRFGRRAGAAEVRRCGVPAGQRPPPQRVVLCGGHPVPGVGGERHGGHRTAVPRERAQAPARVQVPVAHCVVLTAGQREAAVRALPHPVDEPHGPLSVHPRDPVPPVDHVTDAPLPHCPTLPSRPALRAAAVPASGRAAESATERARVHPVRRRRSGAQEAGAGSGRGGPSGEGGRAGRGLRPGSGTGHGYRPEDGAQKLMLPIIPAMFVVSSLMVGAIVDDAM